MEANPTTEYEKLANRSSEILSSGKSRQLLAGLAQKGGRTRLSYRCGQLISRLPDSGQNFASRTCTLAWHQNFSAAAENVPLICKEALDCKVLAFNLQHASGRAGAVGGML